MKKSSAEIGRELGVDGLITGSVMRDGTRVRVTAQLVNAASGSVVWANRYERSAGDVLALQNDVVSAIASEVKATITPEQSARLAAPTRRIDPAAYDAYLKARSLYASFTNSSNPKVLDATIAQHEQGGSDGSRIRTVVRSPQHVLSGGQSRKLACPEGHISQSESGSAQSR
jgi:hypothetical protein